MEITESGIKFSFPEDFTAVKFDDTNFYRQRYLNVEGGKGVDVIADSDDALYIIEVKNCSDTAENQDAWRRHFSGTRNMDTFATEITQKVAHTLACYTGVSSFGTLIQQDLEMLKIAKALQSKRYSSETKKLYILLYLEGDFSCKTRSNETILRDIKLRIQNKLKWLHCRVDVVNTSTHRLRTFNVNVA